MFYTRDNRWALGKGVRAMHCRACDAELILTNVVPENTAAIRLPVASSRPRSETWPIYRCGRRDLDPMSWHLIRVVGYDCSNRKSDRARKLNRCSGISVRYPPKLVSYVSLFQGTACSSVPISKKSRRTTSQHKQHDR
jgi:hypothetical protein